MHSLIYLLAAAYAAGAVLLYLNARAMSSYCGLNPSYSNLVAWKRWYEARGKPVPEWLEKRLRLLERGCGRD
jgi:hypothetical protein